MADPIVAFPIVDPQEDVNQLNQVYSSEYLSSNHNTVFNEMTANERLFVTYIGQGLSPEDAYVKAFPTNNKRYARMKAVNLIKTERVNTAVKEELKPVLDELEIDPKMVLENIKIVAQTAEKDDTKLKALFKLSDIMDMEDKNSAKITQVSGAVFQGFTDNMIEGAERPKEITEKTT